MVDKQVALLWGKQCNSQNIGFGKSSFYGHILGNCYVLIVLDIEWPEDVGRVHPVSLPTQLLQIKPCGGFEINSFVNLLRVK